MSLPLFDLLVIIIMLTIAIALPIVYARVVLGGRRVALRPLKPLNHIDSALVRAAETGNPIHLAPGAGALHGQNIAPESLAGLMLTQRISDIAAKRGATVTVSSGDAVAHLALRGVVRDTYREAGYAEDYHPEAIQLFADHEPLAYAAGVGQRYRTEAMEASVAVGAFGDSFLLLGEQGRKYGVDQIGGTTNPSSLAASILTTNGTLYGEEIYAAEAYVTKTPIGLARLLTHDTLRLIIVGVIIVGIILVSLSDLGIVDAGFPLLPKR